MPGDGRGNFYSKAMAQLEYTHAVGGKALRFPECEAAPVTTFPETHFPEEMGSCQDGAVASTLGTGTWAVGLGMVGHCSAVTRGLKESLPRLPLTCRQVLEVIAGAVVVLPGVQLGRWPGLLQWAPRGSNPQPAD